MNFVLCTTNTFLLRNLWIRPMSHYGIGVGDVHRAARLLKEGKVIALPTDTVYGLATVAQYAPKLFEIKGRANCKPIAICVGSVEDVGKWARICDLPPNLLSALLPGPVTIVLYRSPALSPCLNPGTVRVGIRIPDYPFIQEVTKFLGLPLALTSANRTNEDSCVQPREFRNLWPKLGGIFNGGKLGDVRAGSTVVDLCSPGTYRILRPGSALPNTKTILNSFNLIPRE